MIRRIAPMKINKIPQGKESCLTKLCKSGDYFAELKKDGYWYEYEKSDEGNFLFSSTVSATTGVLVEKSANVPHIMNALDCLPQDTILIGEIYYPHGTSKSVTPIMGSLPEKAIERQNGEFGLLHYYLHDVIFYNGVDLRGYGHYIRYKILESIWNKYDLGNKGDFLELAGIVENNIEEAICNALRNGEEGMVLKKRDCVYHDGMRSPVWETIKVKKTDTCDAVLTGFCEPTKEYTGKEIETWQYWLQEKLGLKCTGSLYGRNDVVPITKAYYYGWKTSIKVSAYDAKGELVEIGTIASGLTEDLEKDFAVNPEKYLNRTVELAGMEKNNEDHTLRHFFFKRFRDDKAPTDCLIDEIFS